MDRQVRLKRAEPANAVLSVSTQYALLSAWRLQFHQTRKGESEMNLDLTRLIDTQVWQTPFYGMHQMA
ncbi:MAG: hypothetical protein AAF636_16910 [Pseudomonadota bacterium]